METNSDYPDFSALCRRCSLGDSYAPGELLQCCIAGLTLFNGALPADMRFALLEQVQSIIHGAAYIVGNEAEERKVRELRDKLQVWRDEFRRATEENKSLAQELHITEDALNTLREENALLHDIQACLELRNAISARYPERRKYLDALAAMRARAENRSAQLQDLENRCVNIMTEMESILGEAFAEEEETWRKREEQTAARP